MNELKNVNEEIQGISSMEVAEMVGKEHKNIIRDIKTVIEHLGGQLKIEPSYFTESTYINSQNKLQPCYILTKKGCELFATRMTGAKGTRFAVRYIERFNEMEQALKTIEVLPSYQIDNPIERAKRWIEEQQETGLLKQELLQLQPKVSYHDDILQGNSLVSTTVIAKDYGLSATAFNRLLNDLGIQYKVNGTWVLYQKHMGNGYTHTETRRDYRGTYIVTKWTQLGRKFLYDFLKENRINPVAG